nr:MAG: nonstructural protein [Microvirus sp.]
MKSKVYAIRDIVMNTYSLPFFSINEGHAKRICADLVQRGEGTVVFDHPEDHDLYFIGEYDDFTGLVSSENYPEFVQHLSDFALS